MDAIILAGGKGTRMQPLTATTPKPLLQVQGRPILEWSLLCLPQTVDHVIVVVNYLREQVADYMVHQSIIRNYTLVEQWPNPLGTGHALQCCQPHLRSHEFLVLNGDDLYDKASVQQLAQQPLAILGSMSKEPSQFGVLKTDGYKLKSIIEKPIQVTPPALVNAGAYKMDQRIFDFQLKLSARNEYEITDYVQYLASSAEVTVVSGAFWFPIGRPEDLAQAQSLDLDALIKAISE
ncbi:MAG: NTP transferase domain-containing protein [Anaerolineae bacterium]|nr:NTP transferase domain-containing protein [Anaerolineae bacterium]